MGFRLGFQILFAVILGIAVGIFFGPYCASLAWIGDAYVSLLQMAIIPFIPFSLVHGIGSLSPQMAQKLFRNGWYFVPLLWLLAMLVIYLLSLPIPTTQPIIISKMPGAERGIMSDLLSIVAPEHPFYNIANNILPAVAIFGLLSGIALMLLKKKDPLLSIFEKVLHILERLLHWLAMLSPIAVFAHIAVAVGTINFTELGQLESYICLVIFGSLFLTLWILPKFLEALGPFSYKELLHEAKLPCLIGFVTGVPSAAFPFMLRTISRLMHKHNLHHENLRSTSQTVIPLAYSFTQLGNLFLYLFVLFMSFFLRESLQTSEKLLLPIHVLFLSLGAPSKSLNGISFLTEHLQWPKNMIEYYVTTNALTQNFQVLLSVASMLCFTLLVLLAYYKFLKIRWSRLISNIGISFGVLLAAIFSVKTIIQPKDRFHDFYMNLSIFDIIKNPVHFQLVNEATKLQPLPASSSTESPIQRVLETRTLKVGYDTRNIPYCYVNNYHELAGYDIACAFKLAKDLDCNVQFIPMDRNCLGEELEDNIYDIGMSAILMDEKRLLKMDFSRPYTQQQNVLLIARNRLSEFGDYNAIRSMPHLRLGASGDYKLVANRHFPEAIQFDSAPLNDLLSGKIDAVIWSKVPAFIWCLSNPDYAILNLGDILGEFYFAYACKLGALEWAVFLDEWLQLREQSGFLEEQRNYWLEGKLPLDQGIRWSIMRDVLHWVK
jgi:proton glutamate symport protein